MKKLLNKICAISIITTLVVLLSGCNSMPSMSSLNFSEEHQQAAVTTQKTRASSYIYFNRLEESQKTAYINIINSANSSEFNLELYITLAMQRKGFIIVHNPDQANVVIRANLVRVGNFTDEQTDNMRNSEFGNSAIKISLAKPKDIDGPLNYGAIIDLQAFERNIPIEPNLEKKTEENTNVNLSGSKVKNELLVYSNSMDWDRFQSRIITQELNTELTQAEVLHDLGTQIEQALYDIIKD